jgi:HEAT repeat protein
MKLAAFLLLAVVPLAARAEDGPDVPALLKRLPAADRASADEVSKALVKGGAPVVQKLLSLLDGPDDARARAALHGLSLYTARPGAAAERKAHSEALASHLSGKAAAPVKVFVLEQLRFAGGPEAVPAVGALLTDEGLCEPAAQALTAIGGDKAAEALRTALPRVSARRRATVVQALGALRDKQAVGSLIKLAGDTNRDLRLTVLAALGNIGDARATDVLIKAVPEKSSFERARAIDACLVLARRLEAAGETKQADSVYNKLIAASKDKKVRELVERQRKKARR